VKRPQPYRLAWAAQPTLAPGVNTALGKQLTNADQMFETLFHDFGAPAAGPLTLPAAPLLATPQLGAIEYSDDGVDGHLYITLHVAGVVTRVLIV
jgi:hypothetical protein